MKFHLNKNFAFSKIFIFTVTILLIVIGDFLFMGIFFNTNVQANEEDFLAKNFNINDTDKNNNIDRNLVVADLQFIANIPFPKELDFCGEKVPLDNPEIRERAEREFYLLLQQPGQLVLYIKRSGKYFPIYERIIKGMNLPDDLKYLSVAESALYQSRSSKNAYGLWQFMEGTAKTYGLRIDKYVDERAHFEKSTVAALTYLSNARKNLGSWTLAAAGYNMGNEGVRKAMAKQKVNNYFDLYLNEETSRFIFRIVLIKELLKNSSKYGLDFSNDEIYSFDKTKIVKVNGSIPDLCDWASSNKNSYKDIKLLNPWILTDQLPDGQWEIMIIDK
jgi:hypothetical protein